MTRAPQYYAPPDGGYAFFSGRDGTRAFVTGEFNETGAGMRCTHEMCVV